MLCKERIIVEPCSSELIGTSVRLEQKKLGLSEIPIKIEKKEICAKKTKL